MTALQFAYQSCSCLVLATSRSKGDDFAAIFPKLPIKIPDLISTNSVAITKIFNRLYSNHVCSKPFLRKIGKSNNDNCLKWVQKTIDYYFQVAGTNSVQRIVQLPKSVFKKEETNSRLRSSSVS